VKPVAYEGFMLDVARAYDPVYAMLADAIYAKADEITARRYEDGTWELERNGEVVVLECPELRSHLEDGYRHICRVH